MAKRAIQPGEECTLTWVPPRIADDRGYEIGDVVTVHARSNYGSTETDNSNTIYTISKPGHSDIRVYRGCLLINRAKRAPNVSIDELRAII